MNQYCKKNGIISVPVNWLNENMRSGTHPMIVLLALALLVSIVFIACKKDQKDFVFKEIPSGTGYDLEGMIFLNDSIGFVCGGSRYEGGILLKSVDGGATWNNVSTEPMTKALYNFYFITHDTGYCCGYDGKIFSSFNGGNTWDFYQTYAWKPLRSIFMFSTYDGYSCGGTSFQRGCLTTWITDEGYWKVDTSDAEYRDIQFFNRQEGIMAGYGKVLRTSDGGASWIITNSKQDFFVSMSFISQQTGYVIGYTGSILKTTDGGYTWDRLRNANSLFQPMRYFNKVAFRDGSNGYIIGEKGCFLRTTDGGHTWNQVKEAPEINLKAISLNSRGGFVCGEGGKIYQFLEP